MSRRIEIPQIKKSPTNEGQGSAPKLHRPATAEQLNVKLVTIHPDATPSSVEQFLGVPLDENAIGFGQMTMNEVRSSFSSPQQHNLPDIIPPQHHDSHPGGRVVGPISAAEHLEKDEYPDEESLRAARRGPRPDVHVNSDSSDYDMD